MVELTETEIADPAVPEDITIRGFKMVKSETCNITFSSSGALMILGSNSATCACLCP